ncbi:hypothetical protein BHM03_00035803 [Ensete ventricosum]|nr:hypothetical protein BHM03_00035803 [Ensete ventricosum]
MAVSVEDVVAGDLAALSVLGSEEYISLHALTSTDAWLETMVAQVADLKGLPPIEEMNQHRGRELEWSH